MLGSTEVQLETRAVQVGYWARVNGVLLNGPRGPQALSHILTIPHLLPRLLALLPFCSPINDLLLLLLRVSTPQSPLNSSLVTLSVRMLDPFAALGKQGHRAAEELLRGIIELGSAAPVAQPPPPGPGQPDLAVVEWRDNSLTRQISDEKTVRTLVDWVLAGTGTKRERRSDVDATPRSGDHTELYTGLTPAERADLRTSSLIMSVSVLVDLIRKNNSDFVEQHMLTWARRKEQEHQDKELLAEEGAELVGATAEGDESADPDKGPPIIDLSYMLAIVADRIAGLQELVRRPRSLVSQPILAHTRAC